MTGARVQAALPWAAFTLLGACMAWVGGVPPVEAFWAAASVAMALLPSGLLAPSGWRRRAAESLLLPAAFVLVMVGDPTMRRMLLPPLLLLPAGGAAAAAFPRVSSHAKPLLLAALALAARFACGLGLVGFQWWHVIVVLAAVAALTWGTTRLAGGSAGTTCALLAGTLPLETAPLWVPPALLAVAAAALALSNPARGDGLRLGGWLPGVAALALVAASLAPWGGIGPDQALSGAGWAVMRVIEKKPFDPAAFAAQKGEIAASLRQQKEQELFRAFLASARERYEITRNAKAYARALGHEQ